ncbi:MAG TPA: DUF4147 domain-containing protein [Candidatus Binataceae bacterium]|nr:DUF4147 domain-containing protein [Candidatus Binataceae bacterium]
MSRPITASRARSDLIRIFASAVASVDPRRVVARALSGSIPDHSEIKALLEEAPRIKVLAVGKAAIGMATQARTGLGPRITGGLIISPAPLGGTSLPAGFRQITASHPLPDASSEEAGRAALDLADRVEDSEILLFLLSGGASALMCAPAEGIGLADKIAVTSSLMRSGASIREINTVRKHLSAIKGGGLLRRLNGSSRMLSLILSDVPGDDLATIGSGPTVADPTSFVDAIGVLKRRKLWGRTPEAVRERLERGNAGELAETLKSGDPAAGRVINAIIGNNATAQDVATEAARALGYTVERWGNLNRDAETVGRDFATYIGGITEERVCVIAGGEPVVTVRGSGRGGRAQHCALATAIGLDSGNRDARICALFAGTDGIDGPTDAAGAIISPATVERGREAKLDAATTLAHNDAYPYFKGLGDLLVTGPTGTNVTDLFIGLINY